MTSELKPCPFCGGEAEIERYGCTRFSTAYHCQDCGCSLETSETFNHGREWNTRADTDVPELVRLHIDSEGVQECKDGEYVRHDQAAAVIAAKDGRITDYKNLVDALHANLAQYEAQEPVMWLCVHDDRGSDRAITTSYPSRRDILKADGYEISPLYSSPLAPEGGRD